MLQLSYSNNPAMFWQFVPACQLKIAAVGSSIPLWPCTGVDDVSKSIIYVLSHSLRQQSLLYLITEEEGKVAAIQTNIIPDCNYAYFCCKVWHFNMEVYGDWLTVVSMFCFSEVVFQKPQLDGLVKPVRLCLDLDACLNMNRRTFSIVLLLWSIPDIFEMFVWRRGQTWKKIQSLMLETSSVWLSVSFSCIFLINLMFIWTTSLFRRTKTKVVVCHLTQFGSWSLYHTDNETKIKQKIIYLTAAVI